MIVEEDAGSGINGRRMAVMDEIARNDLFVSVSKNTLHRTIGGFLEGGKDFFALGGLFGAERQIDDGDIGGWDLFDDKKKRIPNM